MQGFVASVFAICIINSVYLLETLLGYADDVHEEWRLGREVDNDLWCDLMVKIFFLSLNLAGAWLCLFKLLASDSLLH